MAQFIRYHLFLAFLISRNSETCINQNMYKHIPSEKLFISEPNPAWFGNPANKDAKVNWLKSRFHFSFAEYQDPLNQKFGVLRVMNDDLVQPQRGFGTHPHQNMEIVTYVVNGEVTHKDSHNNQETLGKGSIQYMSAGSGVQHSEFNDSKDTPVRFIQTWITPRKLNTPVQYGSYKGVEGQALNKWFHLVGDVQRKDYYKNLNQNPAAFIDQDANFFVSEFTDEITFDLKENRMGYLLCIEGQFNLGDLQINQYDGLKFYEPITLKPQIKSHIIIVEQYQKILYFINLFLFSLIITHFSSIKNDDFNLLKSQIIMGNNCMSYKQQTEKEIVVSFRSRQSRFASKISERSDISNLQIPEKTSFENLISIKEMEEQASENNSSDVVIEISKKLSPTKSDHNTKNINTRFLMMIE
ncbi:hypothetical protein pb186bvf_009585 [Paramecium bursaria]